MYLLVLWWIKLIKSMLTRNIDSDPLWAIKNGRFSFSCDTSVISQYYKIWQDSCKKLEI